MNHLAPGKALLRKVAALIEAKDLATLEELRGRYVVRQEAARMSFSKSRSVVAGETYRRVGLELSEIKNAIRKLKSADGMTEEVIEDGIGDAVAGGIRNVADRVLYGLGSHSARGRLDLSAATKHLYKDWRAYAGRNAAAGDRTIMKRPNLGQLLDFLKFQYGVEITDEELEGIVNQSPDATSDQPDDAEAKNVANGIAPNAKIPAKESVETLKATTLKEYKALRARYLAEADVHDITFNPTTFFPKIANFLIQHGVITVGRHGGQTAGNIGKGVEQTGRLDGHDVEKVPTPASARAAKAATDPKDAPSPEDVDAASSSAMTKDGHFIDAKKFSRELDAAGIHADQMTRLRAILLAGKNIPTMAYNFRQSDKAANAVGQLVKATLDSISKTNLDAPMPDNVTASGNTINLNTMKAQLAAEEVSGADLNTLRAAIGEGTVADIIQGRGKNAELAIKVATAVMHAIEPAKGAARKKAAPAAQPAAAAETPPANGGDAATEG